jgi:site-specific DNA-methyltransferase (adenine-specific)
MKNIIINKDCIVGLKELEDNSIDCCITSPPYWALRDYGCEGQIGQEETPEEYIQKLINIFSEIRRILKNEGTCFINLGDTYAGSGAGTTKNVIVDKYLENSKQVYIMPNGSNKSSKFRQSEMNKSLLMIPYRFAWAMVENGWILRNIINWRKPNQMPQSANDRFTVDFEPIFFFTKQPKYFFQQQFDPYEKPLNRWGGNDLVANNVSTWDNGTGQKTYRTRNIRPNPEGRNMRTTWDINTEPLKDAHFAVYPQKLVERMIKSGCPINGTILDPFMGAGTTAIVARKLNRNYVGFEIKQDYCKISDKRMFQELGMFI